MRGEGVRLLAGERRDQKIEHALGRRILGEQAERGEALLGVFEPRLAHAAQLQLRALREIDEAIAAIARDRCDLARLLRR